MSTIKVNKIENTSTTDGGISIDNSGHVTVDGSNFPTAGPLSNRNLVVNGAMTVAQRATSVTGINSAATQYATVDRMRHAFNSLGTWTSTQESDAPNGFTKSWKVNCTTAESSLSAGDYAIVAYRVEAQDLQHLSYGNSDTQDITISFYVKSNKTGTASFEITQPDNSSKQIVKSYTIDAANTWEYKTITISGDTAGVINDDTGSGLQINWWLGSGSTYTGSTPAAGWEATNNSARNNSNLGLGQAVNDYFQITGIQLEVGSVATPFEHRSFGDELARCQRYYTEGYFRSRLGLSNDNLAEFPIYFKQSMRATPSLSATASLGVLSSISSTSFGTEGCYLDFSDSTNNNYAVTWEANAEL